MDQLKKIIEEKGRILSPSVLKVDSFLNHNVDTVLMDQIGRDFAQHFADHHISRVITIESGGIAPAYAAALHLGIPLVYAKKTSPSTMLHPICAKVHSFTKNTDYTLCMEEKVIHPGDRVLFIDDFLANGQAFLGIQELVQQAGASLCGVGICIEKSWQKGSCLIRSTNIPLYVQASIASMSKEDGIVWNAEDTHAF